MGTGMFKVYSAPSKYGKVYRGEWTGRRTGPAKGAIRVRVAVKRLHKGSFQDYEEWVVSFCLDLKLPRFRNTLNTVQCIVKS